MKTNRMRKILALGCLAGMLGTARLAQAAPITGISTTTTDGYVNLDSVTITRLGTSFTYNHADLIGFDVTAFNCGGNTPIIVPDGKPAPEAGSRATLLDGDRAMNTGLINFEDVLEADTDPAGLRIVFTSPIVNSDGPDVIFFDATGTATGNKVENVHVSVTGLSTGKTYLGGTFPGSDGFIGDYSQQLLPSNFNLDVYKTRNETNTGDAQVNTLALLESRPVAWNSNADNFNVYGLAIDLSDLGVAPGATVSSLDFRSTHSGDMVDPMFIAGLPAVPEPGSMGLALAAAGLLVRRRTR